MALTLLSAVFDDTRLGMHGTRTVDGQVLSVLFDDLQVDSSESDVDAAPQVCRAEGVLQCEGTGWVAVQVRGAALSVGTHGFAHALGWANGRRLRAAPLAPGEPFAASVTAPVGSDGRLRLSLLLLAQRDLGLPDSAAACWVDSIDITVVPDPQAHGQQAQGQQAHGQPSTAGASR